MYLFSCPHGFNLKTCCNTTENYRDTTFKSYVKNFKYIPTKVSLQQIFDPT